MGIPLCGAHDYGARPQEYTVEHRCGIRVPADFRVRLFAAPACVGWGRLRDVSSSGAFIETTLQLPMHARVMLNVRGNESATHEVDMAATVARVDNDGIGVEWYETPAGSICAVLGCTTLCAALKVMTD